MRKIIVLLTLLGMTTLLTACGPTRSSNWQHARTVLNVEFERLPSQYQIAYRGTNRNNYPVCAKVIAIDMINSVHVDSSYGFVRIEPGQTLYFGRVRPINRYQRSTWTMRFRVRRDASSC